MIGEAHHYGVVVSDLDRSIEFYRDNFEMEVLARVDYTDRHQDVIGVEGAQGEGALLDANGFILELKCYHSPENKNVNETRSLHDVGDDHICFKVDDLDEVYERLSEVAEFVDQPITMPYDVKIAYMYDPDGNVIEFIEGDPGI